MNKLDRRAKSKHRNGLKRRLTIQTLEQRQMLDASFSDVLAFNSGLTQSEPNGAEVSTVLIGQAVIESSPFEAASEQVQTALPAAIKTVVAPSNAHWPNAQFLLDHDNWLWINGTRTWADTEDFGFDRNGALYKLMRGGTLIRHTTASGWQTIAGNMNRLETSPENAHWPSAVFTLDRNNWMWINGTRTWADTVDFGFDHSGALYKLMRGGTLLKHTQTSGWETIPGHMNKLEVSPANSAWPEAVFTLDRNNWLWINGTRTWADTEDFAFDGSGKLYKLMRGGTLLKHTQASGWQNVAGLMNKLEVSPANSAWPEAVFTLDRNNWLWVNGVRWWADTVDFGFDGTGALYKLMRGGTLLKHTQASGWQNLSQGVAKFTVGPDGLVYALAGTTLRRFDDGAVQTMAQVSNFEISGTSLRLHRTDGTTETAYLFGDFANSLSNSVTTTNSGATSNGNQRDIVGTTLTNSQLNQIHVNTNGQSAAHTLLSSVVKLDVGTGPFGTGTVLALGGNRYVLTADHVVTEFSVGQTLSRVPGTPVIRRIIRSDGFGNRDLALIELDRAVPGVNGALLPSFQLGSKGMRVITADFGRDNEGNSGNFNFGFTHIDGFSNGATDGYVGRMVDYRFDPGEAATAGGDSGGPDIVPWEVTDSFGNRIWLPMIAAVHQSGESIGRTPAEREAIKVPAIGMWTSSTLLDNTTLQLLRNYLPREAQPTLRLESLHVINDGDGKITIGDCRGCWYFAVEINGLPQWLYTRNDPLRVRDNTTYNLGIPITLPTNVSAIKVAFWGFEKDTGWFQGKDDIIPRWETSRPVAVRDLGLGRSLFTSGVVRGKDTSYIVTFSLGW